MSALQEAAPEPRQARHHPRRSKLRGAGYFRRLGPGIVTGAADDDPSGIGTYSQVGAASGYQFVWTAPALFPLAFAVQEACARLALASGTGLAGLIRQRLPKPVLWVCIALVVVANVANIAADLSSMGAVLAMITPVPAAAGVMLLGAGIGIAEIVIPYRTYARFLRWLCLSLLAYVAVLAVADVDWGQVLRSMVPSMDGSTAAVAAVIALAGTTISPYLFFWQAAEEVEEMEGKASDVSQAHVRAMRGDVFAGMVSGVVVMFAIMTSTAATLHQSGVTVIETPQAAAGALAPIAGSLAGLLFSLGILGTGLLAVPVLAGSTAYAVCETAGWREGLSRKPRQAVAFYGTIIVSIAIGCLATWAGVNPIHGLFLAAVLNGLAAPVLLGVIWYLARDRDLLGDLRSPKWSQALVGFCALFMAGLPILWIAMSLPIAS